MSLYQTHSFLFPVLSFIGGKFFDKACFLFQDIDAANILLHHVSKNNNLLLHELDETTVKSLNSRIIRQSSINYKVDIDQWDITNLSTKRRKLLVKNQKKYNLSIQKSSWDKLPQNILDIFNIEGASYKSEKNRSMFGDPQIQKLFLQLVENAKNYMVVYFLTYWGKRIAYDFWIYDNWRYMSYNSAFSKGLDRISPWNILQRLLLDELKKDHPGLTYDFSRWYTKQKFSFSKNNHYYNYSICLSQNILFLYYIKLTLFTKHILAWAKKLLKKILINLSVIHR